MKRTLLTAFVGFALILNACGDDEEKEEASHLVNMGGVVSSALDMQPVADLTVRAISPTIWFQGGSDSGPVDLTQAEIAKTTTDANGKFMFEDLNVDEFFMFIIFAFGDADGQNQTYMNTGLGTALVDELIVNIDNNNTEELDALTDLTGYVVPMTMVTMLEAGALSNFDLEGDGFTFGFVLDTDNNPVPGCTVVHKTDDASGYEELTGVAYRFDGASGAMNFDADATGFSGMFVVGDVLELDMAAMDTEKLLSMQGTTLSGDTEGGEAVSTPGFAFTTRVYWE